MESVYALDSNGNRIPEITKDTPAFTLVVTYADYGLREVETDEFTDRSMDVYLTETGGFLANQGTKGTLRYQSANSTDAPRFRASFTGMTWKENGSATVSLRANYEVYGYDVTGSVTTSVPQVLNAEEDDDDEIAPLLPHIIVNQYSYGSDHIVAGDEFTLHMTILNTSKDIPLENIVMTITPLSESTTSNLAGSLTITSASNSYYMDALGVGQSQSHSIDLRAEPNAAVGSHRIEVGFKFQYVDEVNKKRESAEDTESIAIPVTQIDRFDVDPITEIPEMMFTGEDGWLEVSFINRGKSTTYNISGTVKAEGSVYDGQNQHYGNLEAGATGKLEFDLLAHEPGELTGEVVIIYEDENANEKEISTPFVVFVESSYYPEPDFPGMDEGMFDEEGGSLNPVTATLCVLGGLMLAAPIALYLYKRVKAKGIEALDEDF